MTPDERKIALTTMFNSSVLQAVATPAALSVLDENETPAIRILNRHFAGDWGTLDEHDAQMNEEALVTQDRVMSVYLVGEQKVWVITDPGWETTTILLPEDY